MKTIINLLRSFVDWLENKNKKPPKRVDGIPSRFTHVALIVGHTNKAVGAMSYNGEYERWYNEKVAKLVAKKVITKKCKVFYRDGVGRKGVAKKAAAWAGDDSLSIELHFNAFHKAAFGTETLCLKEDSSSRDVAERLSKSISLRFQTILRGKEGVLEVSNNGRGGMNLQYCKDAGFEASVLAEPFFGNFETQESRKFLEGKGWLNYAECLALFIDSL